MAEILDLIAIILGIIVFILTVMLLLKTSRLLGDFNFVTNPAKFGMALLSR